MIDTFNVYDMNMGFTATYSERSERFAVLVGLTLKDKIGDGRKANARVRAKDVAEAIGMQRTMLSKYLNGRQVLPLQTLVEICEALDVPAKEIIDKAYLAMLAELGPPPQ